MAQTAMSLGLSAFASERRTVYEDGILDGTMRSPTMTQSLRKGRALANAPGSTSTSMRKSQSDSVLHGVSTKANSENVRALRSLQSLGEGGRRGPKYRRMASGVANSSGNVAGVDQEAALKDFDKLSTAIVEVKNGFDAFDPRRAGRKNVPFSVILAGGKAIRDDKDEGGGDEDAEALREAEERKAERLQAYKFARKFEPELPPLAPLPPSAPKKPPPQTIIARNASVEAIGVWLPQRRRERIETFAEEKKDRTEHYNLQKETMDEEHAEFWMQDLMRKRAQANLAVQERKNGKRTSASEFPVEKWMALMWTVGWLQQIKQELDLKKMPTSERIEYVNQNKNNLLLKRNLGLGEKKEDESTKIAAIAANTTVCKVFACAVAGVKLKKKLKESRKNAGKVLLALKQWQVAGQVIFSFKRIVHCARSLQKWWRTCSARLRDQREKISQRWERIEKQELATELSKFDRQAAVGSSRRSLVTVPGLGMEERIGLEMVPKAVRLKFLEHELRARRYFLLPQIDEWEKEKAIWQKNFQEYLDQKKAYAAMGQEYGDQPGHGFKWPPTRPMHLPPSHPIGEVSRGAICSMNCPGRRGDEEILDMWTRCRADPRSWKRVPRAGEKIDKKKKKEASKEDQPAQDQRKAVSLDSLLDTEEDQNFGEAPEKEMKTFGVDDSTMPGGEPPSEKEEPRVAAPC